MGNGETLMKLELLMRKKGGRQRSEVSLRWFNDFVSSMVMEEIRYVGRKWTWANN